MHIISKSQEADLCEWYLLNIKSEDSVRKMYAYFIENKCIRNNLSTSQWSISKKMSGDPLKRFKKVGVDSQTPAAIWGLTNRPVSRQDISPRKVVGTDQNTPVILKRP